MLINIFALQVCNQESGNNTWILQVGWNGTCPVLYMSFDTLDGLAVMEGTSQIDYVSVVQGKVRLKFSANQYLFWVPLQ